MSPVLNIDGKTLMNKWQRYYLKNKEKCKQARKEYYLAHRKYFMVLNRRWYWMNRDADLALKRLRYQAKLTLSKQSNLG